jgi:hypothetical protein
MRFRDATVIIAPLVVVIVGSAGSVNVVDHAVRKFYCACNRLRSPAWTALVAVGAVSES